MSNEHNIWDRWIQATNKWGLMGIVEDITDLLSGFDELFSNLLYFVQPFAFSEKQKKFLDDLMTPLDDKPVRKAFLGYLKDHKL